MVRIEFGFESIDLLSVQDFDLAGNPLFGGVEPLGEAKEREMRRIKGEMAD